MGDTVRDFLTYVTVLLLHGCMAEIPEAYVYDALRTPRGRGKASGSLYEVKPVSLVVGLIDDLNYVNLTYAGSPAYMRFGGRPIIYFFGHEAYTIDWTRVRGGVAGNPMFVFRNGSAFSKAQSNGGFSWVAPEMVSATNLMAMNYLDNYYKTALSFSSVYSTGSGYKGFNDTLALWGANRLIGQQCGQTWLNSIAEAGKYYSPASQMLGIQLVTWNDYEEGSEIETGIDNCVTVSASATGTVVSWSITGQMNTVDHFSVFASQDGADLMWLADAPTTVSTLDLAQFSLNSGNYVIFVKATGKPSLTMLTEAGIEPVVAQAPGEVARRLRGAGRIETADRDSTSQRQ
jgi:hypothetical protein